MKQYHELLQHILNKGRFKGDRTGTGTTSIFGYQMRFDLSEGLPLVTTKFVPIRAVIHELLWFLSGDTNIKYLLDNNVHIWDDWAYCDRPEVTIKKAQWLSANNVERYRNIMHHLDRQFGSPDPTVEEHRAAARAVDAEYRLAGGPVLGPEYGDLGPVYGAMWRSWPSTIDYNRLKKIYDDYKNWKPHAMSGHFDNGSQDLASDIARLLEERRPIDQIAHVIDTLRNNPTSRRIVVSGWNPALLPVEGASHASNVENGLQALPPCHATFQFYAEELTLEERQQWAEQNLGDAGLAMRGHYRDSIMEQCDILNVPKYRLSCQLYQR